MDAMQKFLEYASAYDDGSDTRIKLKIIHTQKGDGGDGTALQRRSPSEQDKNWRICVRYITISEDLSS